MITAPQVKPRRNEECWCGSGQKYKVCHLEQDRRTEQEQRELARGGAAKEVDEHESHRCSIYKPETHKIPAVERPDFIISVRNLASAGDGSWLHIDGPIDLGRDQLAVDRAIEFLRQRCVLPDFRRDPDPDVVAGTQAVLDKMCGRGVFFVQPSGVRLRKYGQTEIVAPSDGSAFAAYLSGRGSCNDTVELLLAAVAADGRALGVQDGILALVWPLARVLREVVVDHLALPVAIRDRSDRLVDALIEDIASRSDALEVGGLTVEAAQTVALLPYLVALREAVRDPEGQLRGMGLSDHSVEVLSVQVHAAAELAPWLAQLADAAGSEWETPDGYLAWVERARAIPEVADVLDGLPGVSAQPQDQSAGAQPGEQPEVAASGSQFAAGPAVEAPTAVPASPRSLAAAAAGTRPSVFAELDRVADEHAASRKTANERLSENLDRQMEVDRRRRELVAALDALEVEVSEIREQQLEATTGLERLAEAESRDRRQKINVILARGVTTLREAEAMRSSAIGSLEGRDVATLAYAEKVVREYEDMERRGVVGLLPAGIRERVELELESSRATLRESLGGRDPITIPAVVTVEDDSSALVLNIGVPLSVEDDLPPGALQTAVAAAVADAVADTVRSMPQISLISTEHDGTPLGASVLRLTFSGPPPVTAEDCAQYCSLVLAELSTRRLDLRRAGVSIDARVEPDLEWEADT